MKGMFKQLSFYGVCVSPDYKEWSRRGKSHLSNKLYSKLKNNNESPAYLGNVLFGLMDEKMTRADLKLPKKALDFYPFEVWKDAKSVDDCMSSIEINPTFGFFVSENVKTILDEFILPKHCYYPVEVSYKKEQLVYYFLLLTKEQPLIAWEDSCIYYNKILHKDLYKELGEEELAIYPCTSYETWTKEVWKESGSKNKHLKIKQLVFSKAPDLYSSLVGTNHWFYCSELLKNRLETAGITGLDFSELEEREAVFYTK